MQTTKTKDKMTTAKINGTHCRKQKINQFGDYDDTTNMSCEDWSKRWKKEQTQFHMPKVHPMLEKHFQQLTDGKPNRRIFVPLSGKSLDLKWLLDAGEEVVGCDCAEEGCKEVFERENIPYTSEYRQNVKSKLFKAKDGRKLSIYSGDFFNLQRKELGDFDCVWDRGSFVAIPVDKRQEYADMIVSTLTNDSRYLLDCFLVDNEKFGGPPFDCTAEHVEKYFGKHCTIEKLESKDVFGNWQKSWGITSFVEEVYLLRLK